MREGAASPFACHSRVTSYTPYDIASWRICSQASYSELIYAENRFTKVYVLMETVLKRSSWRLKT